MPWHDIVTVKKLNYALRSLIEMHSFILYSLLKVAFTNRQTEHLGLRGSTYFKTTHSLGKERR